MYRDAVQRLLLGLDGEDYASGGSISVVEGSAEDVLFEGEGDDRRIVGVRALTRDGAATDLACTAAVRRPSLSPLCGGARRDYKYLSLSYLCTNVDTLVPLSLSLSFPVASSAGEIDGRTVLCVGHHDGHLSARPFRSGRVTK